MMSDGAGSIRSVPPTEIQGSKEMRRSLENEAAEFRERHIFL